MASETFINELGDEVTLSVRPYMGYAVIELRSAEPQGMSLTAMEARKLRELIAREEGEHRRHNNREARQRDIPQGH